MDAFFEELGAAVLARWKRENFSLPAFPGIAVAAIDERRPGRRLDLSAVMRDFLAAEPQPPQTDSPFGEPELVVYSHSRFYIQLLFWLDGTTAIHQHEFSGAFHVLHGSSIHASYEFEKPRPVTPYLKLGSLRLKKMELLETGRTVPILSGPGAIHSLFHLDTPSVTLVVRTQHDPGTGPQFNYLPPHVALDPHHADPLTVRRNQLLDVLERLEDPGYAGRVTEMLADLDFERGFHVLRNCMPHLREIHQWDAAVRTFEKRHGALSRGVAESLIEEARRDGMKALRGAVVEPEHRFFLALLMNAPTRRDLLSLVSDRYPRQRPEAVVMRWAEELMEATDEGVSILDATFPETIEIEIDARPELFLAAFAYLLKPAKKLPPELRNLSTVELKDLGESFARSALGLLLT